MENLQRTITLLFLVAVHASVAVAQQGNTVFSATEVSLPTPTGTLYGTLTVPRGKSTVPVVLLISGSGPTDRNGNQPTLQNNSLRFLAEDLTKAGIAVLRYDKRMIAKSQTGQQERDLRFASYVNDAAAWIDTLRKDERFFKVLVVGHSEGSLIGMMAVQKSGADGFISIAGTGRPADEVILDQLRTAAPALYEASDRILDSLRQGITVDNVDPSLTMLFRPGVQPYMISWIKYDPAAEIARLDMPVLVVQGSTDIQVGTSDAKMLAAANDRAVLKVIDGMNHILKNALADRQQNMATYMNPDLPVSRELIKSILEFIRNQ